MATTFKGIPYPTSSDNIAPLETHFANLADKADKAGVVSAVQTFTGPADAASSPATVTVTFSTAFPSAPKVIAAVQGSAAASPYVCNVYGEPTTTGFVVKVHRVSGSTAESLKLVWMASTYA